MEKLRKMAKTFGLMAICTGFMFLAPYLGAAELKKCTCIECDGESCACVRANADKKKVPKKHSENSPNSHQSTKTRP